MSIVKNSAGIPYVTQNAILRCPFGLMTSILNVVDSTRASIGKNKMAVQSDKVPLVNIPIFGMCTSIVNPAVQAATLAAMGTLTPAACPGVKAIMGWSPPPSNVLNSTSRYLLQTCTLLCSFGGNIHIVHSGQGVVNPVAVPCKPEESNYELPGWLEGVTTVAGLTPWGVGLSLVEAAGNVYNGNYLDAALGVLPFKKLAKGGKLVSKPVNKVLNKMGTSTDDIALKIDDAIVAINRSNVGQKIQQAVDSPVGQKLTRTVIGDPSGSVGKKIADDVSDTGENLVKKGISSLWSSDEPEGLEDNTAIAKAATRLPPDQFDKYTDYAATDEAQ